MESCAVGVWESLGVMLVCDLLKGATVRVVTGVVGTGSVRLLVQVL
jgi:hypothetical protein